MDTHTHGQDSASERTYLLVSDNTATNYTNDNTSPSHQATQPNGGDKNNEEDNQKSFTFKTMSGRQKTTFILMALVNLFAGCGFSLPAPFFPQEATKKGVSNTVIGLIFSLFQLVMFLFSPICGKYLTTIGPKFMFVSGILVSGSCSVLFGLLDRCPPGETFIIMCFACRCVEALGISGLLTASFAIISNEFPKNVAFVIGSLETASGVGMMIGPALGGVLYEVGGFGPPFFTVGGLIFVNGILIYRFLPSYEEVEDQKKQSFITLMKSVYIWVCIIVVTSTAIGISFLDPTLSPHLESFHLSTALIGVVFTIAPALYGASAPLFGYLCDSKGYTFSLMIIGSFSSGIGLLMLGPTPYLAFLPSKLWVVIVGSVILGLGIGCAAIPVMKCMIVAACEVGFEDNMDTYGLVSGLFNSVWSLGGFVGPTVGGVLVSQLGDFDKASSAVSLLFFFAVICTVLYYCARIMSSRSQQPTLTSVNKNETDALGESTPILTSSSIVHVELPNSVEERSPGTKECV